MILANGFRWTLPFLAAGLAACSGAEADASASLDRPITLERVRTIIRHDTTAATAWLSRISDLQFDPVRGHLLARDIDDQRIVEFTTDGEFAGYFGRRGEGPGEISNLRDFAVGTDQVTVFDQGNGKLIFFDRATREMRDEIRFDRRLRDMAAISDTLLAVTPGPAGTLFELIHIDDRRLGSFGDGSYTETGDIGLSLDHVGDGLLFVLKPAIPEGRLYQLDGSVAAEVGFAELEHVLAEWRGDFTEMMERSRLVDRGGRRISGGKFWVSPPGALREGSFFLTASPQSLDVNPWEFWVLDLGGRITGRYVFDRTSIRGFAASFPTVYALGLGDEFGVYEYHIP